MRSTGSGRQRARGLVVAIGAIALLASGCGDDDDAETTGTEADPGSTSQPAGSVVDETVAPIDEEAISPIQLGYRMTADTETDLRVEGVMYLNHDEEQTEESRFLFVRDGLYEELHSGFVTGFDVTFEVTRGGPVTIEAIEGRHIDPYDARAGVEVIEVLSTIEVASGDAPVPLTAP